MNAPAGHTSIELGFPRRQYHGDPFCRFRRNGDSLCGREIRAGGGFYAAGGVDILSKFYYEALCRFHALSPLDGKKEACLPFDEARNGTVAGEGCGLIVLKAGSRRWPGRRRIAR